MIDLGMLGFSAKRFWSATADAPEKTIQMRRPLHVRGRVTDADTGRPITAFTLVPGFTWENIQNVWWLNDRAKELTGLSYDVVLSTEAGLGVIRIEAEGYLPETSRGMKDDEEDAVVHFALHRGAGISGVVRLPDGSPLAGADVLLSTPARPLQLNNGRPQVGMSDQRVVKTRADGRFNLRALRAAIYHCRRARPGSGGAASPGRAGRWARACDRALGPGRRYLCGLAGNRRRA